MAYIQAGVTGNTITPDATPVDVPVFTLAAGTAVAFDGIIVAIAADGTAASWQMFGLAKKLDGGPATLVGNTLVAANPQDVGTLGWTVAFVVDGDSIVARLTGSLLQAVDWTVRMDVTVTP